MSNNDGMKNDKREVKASTNNGSTERTNTELEQDVLSAKRLEVGRDAGW